MDMNDLQQFHEKCLASSFGWEVDQIAEESLSKLFESAYIGSSRSVTFQVCYSSNSTDESLLIMVKLNFEQRKWNIVYKKKMAWEDSYSVLNLKFIVHWEKIEPNLNELFEDWWPTF